MHTSNTSPDNRKQPSPLHSTDRLLIAFWSLLSLVSLVLHSRIQYWSWVHPGFSVYAGPPVDAAEMASLESQARYITRPAVTMDSLQKLDDGSLVMDTPPDLRTGATSIELDAL